MIDLEAIKRAAEAATPGPWEAKNWTDVFTRLGAENAAGIAADGNDGWQVADCARGGAFSGGFVVDLNYRETKANAEHIASANPAAVLELIARLETAERRVAELEAREERHRDRALDALAEINVSLGLE